MQYANEASKASRSVVPLRLRICQPSYHVHFPGISKTPHASTAENGIIGMLISRTLIYALDKRERIRTSRSLIPASRPFRETWLRTNHMYPYSIRSSEFGEQTNQCVCYKVNSHLINQHHSLPRSSSRKINLPLQLGNAQLLINSKDEESAICLCGGIIIFSPIRRFSWTIFIPFEQRSGDAYPR